VYPVLNLVGLFYSLGHFILQLAQDAGVTTAGQTHEAFALRG
jgi:hypothetical protein